MYGLQGQLPSGEQGVQGVGRALPHCPPLPVSTPGNKGYNKKKEVKNNLKCMRDFFRMIALIYLNVHGPKHAD